MVSWLLACMAAVAQDDTVEGSYEETQAGQFLVCTELLGLWLGAMSDSGHAIHRPDLSTQHSWVEANVGVVQAAGAEGAPKLNRGKTEKLYFQHCAIPAAYLRVLNAWTSLHAIADTGAPVDEVELAKADEQMVAVNEKWPALTRLDFMKAYYANGAARWMERALSRAQQVPG